MNAVSWLQDQINSLIRSHFILLCRRMSLILYIYTHVLASIISRVMHNSLFYLHADIDENSWESKGSIHWCSENRKYSGRLMKALALLVYWTFWLNMFLFGIYLIYLMHINLWSTFTNMYSDRQVFLLYFMDSFLWWCDSAYALC